MPMPIITVPPFANVPFALGVPFMVRSASFPPTPNPALAFSDSASIDQGVLAPKWGLYDTSGAPIVEPDSVTAFSFAVEYRISDYPVEQGAFASYNKVATPFDVRLIVTKQGPGSARQNFLNQLDDLISLLTLFDVVTPDKTYLNANLVHYDYERSAAKGVSLLTVSLFLREVRSAPSPITAASIAAATPAPLEDTKQPSAADPLSAGVVQPQPLTTSQMHGVTGAWGGNGATGSW